MWHRSSVTEINSKPSMQRKHIDWFILQDTVDTATPSSTSPICTVSIEESSTLWQNLFSAVKPTEWKHSEFIDVSVYVIYFTEKGCVTCWNLCFSQQVSSGHPGILTPAQVYLITNVGLFLILRWDSQWAGSQSSKIMLLIIFLTQIQLTTVSQTKTAEWETEWNQMQPEGKARQKPSDESFKKSFSWPQNLLF